ncbi:MAG: hypothetical protein QOH63_705 [Acidobacteriota bacterium]|jgi:hypothetical protein|nr:hypothetical protein [Acidobacteriota bacterium]
MLLSQTITIYLAVGASFGVNNFLRKRNDQGFAETLLRVARATILWPFMATRILAAHQKFDASDAARASGVGVNPPSADKVEQARRRLLESLYGISELEQKASGRESQEIEQASRAFRECVEKYSGLTLAAAEIDLDAPPSEREMELYRIAGRKGDDLLTAGRCIQRSNAARLTAHQARARIEFLHALAEIREIAGNAASRMSFITAHQMSVATLKFYGHALELLSLLEDEDAAMSVTRLLDAECGQLRRLLALNLKERSEHAPKEEESCVAHAPRLAFTGLSQTKPLNQG